MYSAVAAACKHIIGKGITEINSDLTFEEYELICGAIKERRLTFEEYELICGAVNVGTDKFLEPRKAGSASLDGR